MHPAKVDRHRLHRLTDLPNVGPAMAADLQRLGFSTPQQLQGACPWALYERLCALTGERHDPCVIDVFMSITRFLEGEAPAAWWTFTPERQAALATRSQRALPW